MTTPVLTTTPTGAALTPPDRAELILGPLRRDSLAFRTGTIITTNRKSVNVPVLTEEIDNVDAVAEGAVLPEGAPTVVERTLVPVKFGITSTLSDETVADSNPAALNVFGSSVAAMLRRRLDANYLFSDGQPHGTPPATAPVGVLTTSGIVAGGTLGTNLDVITDAIAAIEEADGRADVIVMSPRVWGILSKFKVGGSDSNAPLLGSPTAPGATQALDALGPGRSLFGVRVYTDPLIDDLTIGVWDSRAVAVALREDARLDIDYSAKFEADSAVVRGTLRAAWEVLFPARVVKITVGP